MSQIALKKCVCPVKTTFTINQKERKRNYDLPNEDKTTMEKSSLENTKTKSRKSLPNSQEGEEEEEEEKEKRGRKKKGKEEERERVS